MSATTNGILCVGSLEFHEQEGLHKDTLIWVRLRLICEADGKTLWHDSFKSINDVKKVLDENEIDYYDVVKLADPRTNIYVARAKSESISAFAPWTPGASVDSLYVRTFLTIINKNGSVSSEIKDIFDKDSCWNTVMMDSNSITDWFKKIREIKSNLN